MEAHLRGLGPFAPEQGALSRAAATAAVAAAIALALSLIRPVSEQALGLGEQRWAGRVGLALGIAAVVASLLAMYRVAARGERGRVLARLALFIAVAGAGTAYAYAAVVDGNVQLSRFFRLYFDIDLMRTVAPDIARGLVNTLKAAFMSELLAIVVGLVVATFELSPRRILRWPAIWYVDAVRGLPLLVLAFLLYFGTPYIGITLSPFTGIVLALTINASAYVAEIFRAGIQSVPRGQMDAARSVGMPHALAMTTIIIPQAVRAVIPPLMSEFIALVKDTAIVYAVVGFTVQTRDVWGAARQGSASTFSPTPLVGGAVGYLIVTIPLTRLVGRMERRLRAGLA